jgi:hypothetical protein
MEGARTKGGVHAAPTAQANKYSQAELALMRTQDVGYLRAKATAEAKVRAGAALAQGGGGAPPRGGAAWARGPVLPGEGSNRPTARRSGPHAPQGAGTRPLAPPLAGRDAAAMAPEPAAPRLCRPPLARGLAPNQPLTLPPTNPSTPPPPPERRRSSA